MGNDDESINHQSSKQQVRKHPQHTFSHLPLSGVFLRGINTRFCPRPPDESVKEK